MDSIDYRNDLERDAEKIISGLFGDAVARQTNGFDDPRKYPKDFLDECTFFLSKFIGDEAAKRKFGPLYRKYAKS